MCQGALHEMECCVKWSAALLRLRNCPQTAIRDHQRDSKKMPTTSAAREAPALRQQAALRRSLPSGTPTRTTTGRPRQQRGKDVPRAMAQAHGATQGRFSSLPRKAAAAAVGGGRLSGPAPPASHAGLRQRPRTLLLHLALLSAACLAGTLLASRSSSRGSGVTTAATAADATASAAPANPSAAVLLAVVAPLQQASPFGVRWKDVLEHTGLRLRWSDPGFQLTIHDSEELSSATSAAARSLAADLQHSQAAVAIGVTDAAAAATLAPLLAAAPTAIALGSAPALAGATRLGGRAPPAGPPAGLAALLAKLLPGGKQAELDTQVLLTAGSGGVSWGVANWQHWRASRCCLWKWSAECWMESVGWLLPPTRLLMCPCPHPPSTHCRYCTRSKSCTAGPPQMTSCSSS